jgi:type I restriction enzyme, S subunit
MAEIPKGYKHTEVGMIPEEWEVKPLREIVSLMTNGFVGTVKSFYAEHGNGILYIQGYNVRENKIRFDGIKYVTPEFHRQHSKSSLREGDLLTIQTGDIGITTVVPKELEGANCHALIISRFLKSRVEPYFYSYYFNSKSGRLRLMQIETGSTMKHINVGHMIDLKVPLPSLPEQRAIAAALSDMDALIEAQEKLIAKKKAIKQGAMQELLRPKSSWKEQQLSAIGKSYGGLSGKTKEDFEDGDCPYIPFMNVMTNPIIDTNYFDYVQIKPAENQNKAEQGDLFFNGSSETPEEVGMCSVLLEEVKDLYLNSFCFGFRFHKEVDYDGLFMAYFFRSNYGRDKMFLLAQGATRFNLSKSNFLKLRIMLPPFIEQKRIARILSDMDSEIAQMEAQLDKYRNLKQGMMQELLTGKIRLI